MIWFAILLQFLPLILLALMFIWICCLIPRQVFRKDTSYFELYVNVDGSIVYFKSYQDKLDYLWKKKQAKKKWQKQINRGVWLHEV